MQLRVDNSALFAAAMQRSAWTVWNALQFGFTLLWTAARISFVLCLRALTGNIRGRFGGPLPVRGAGAATDAATSRSRPMQRRRRCSAGRIERSWQR